LPGTIQDSGTFTVMLSWNDVEAHNTEMMVEAERGCNLQSLHKGKAGAIRIA